MSFLYAVPGCDNNSVDWTALGLSYAFTNNQPQRGLDMEGFTGEKTAVLADQSLESRRLRIRKEEQVWQECSGYWIGYWKDLVPTPDSLQKELMLKGKDITVESEGSKSTWTVPTAVTFDEANGEIFNTWHLSRYVTFGPDGEFQYGDVEAKYASLFDIAMQWINSGDEGVLLKDLWKWAGIVLSYNYRVTSHELCMLKVLTDNSAKDIMDICVDISSLSLIQQAVKEPEKKSSASDDLSTSDGVTVETDSTSQLQPTS